MYERSPEISSSIGMCLLAFAPNTTAFFDLGKLMASGSQQTTGDINKTIALKRRRRRDNCDTRFRRRRFVHSRPE
jgi:hypothetical protein